MKPQNEKKSSTGIIIALTSAIITAVTTITVSYIGIIPSLQRDKDQEILELKNKVAELIHSQNKISVKEKYIYPNETNIILDKDDIEYFIMNTYRNGSLFFEVKIHDYNTESWIEVNKKLSLAGLCNVQIRETNDTSSRKIFFFEYAENPKLYPNAWSALKLTEKGIEARRVIYQFAQEYFDKNR